MYIESSHSDTQTALACGEVGSKGQSSGSNVKAEEVENSEDAFVEDWDGAGSKRSKLDRSKFGPFIKTFGKTLRSYIYKPFEAAYKNQLKEIVLVIINISYALHYCIHLCICQKTSAVSEQNIVI